MSTTLVRTPPSPLDRSAPPRLLMLDMVGVATPLLVVALAVAAMVGAPIGPVEMAAAAVSIVLALAVRRSGGTQTVSVAWLIAMASTAGLVGMHAESVWVAGVVSVGLVMLSAAVTSRPYHVLVAGVVIVLQLMAWVESGSEAALTALVMTATVALGGVMTVNHVRWRMAGSRAEIEALTDERSTVAKLYEVASSIGASTTRAEALPDLLGAVAEGVGARSCAVALLDGSGSRLVLTGPVWVNGAHIPVDDDVAAPMTRGGMTERALRASRAIRFERTGASDLDPILADLGLQSGLVASLRLEGRERGLLFVGDPVIEPFGDDQIAELTALATPVSLVLAQVGHHEAAAEMARSLKEIADMKTDFVSMVSHELKTPLTSVMGALDTLARPELSPDNPAMAEMVHAARRQALRLRRLIDDLLVLSRIDRGLVEAEPTVVVLRQAVVEAVGLVPGSDVSVAVPERLTVQADADHLGQVLTNLLENARKYAPGSPVQVGAMSIGDGEVAITVCDHGPGIPEQQRRRVFDRFVRLDPSGAVGGTGLGLSIVHMLVEGMGGRVELEETPGGGATFVVILPEPR